jgi:transcriptional regulator with XRE-family HTH domain
VGILLSMKSPAVLPRRDTEQLTLLGRRLRAARLRRKLTQDEMAERVGVSRPTYRMLEAGRPGVALGILQRALVVLGYSDRLGALLETDPIGEELEDVSSRRVGLKRSSFDVANF